MIIAATSDLAGKMRGKAFPAHEFEKRLKRGVGWTPTNVQITCFDVIAESPYGALGDLVLIPDPSALVRADFGDDGPAEQFVIGDILTTSGEPWECCTRSILKQALARLEDVTGLHLKGAFEHEFQFIDGGCPPGSAYTTAGFRAERVFAETLFSVFGEAGLKADTFMKEYGADQYEVTIGPSTKVRIAISSRVLPLSIAKTSMSTGSSRWHAGTGPKRSSSSPWIRKSGFSAAKGRVYCMPK